MALVPCLPWLRIGAVVVVALLAAVRPSVFSLTMGAVGTAAILGPVALRRELATALKGGRRPVEIQRFRERAVYVAYRSGVRVILARVPYVKNFAPNVGHDHDGMAEWLDT